MLLSGIATFLLVNAVAESFNPDDMTSAIVDEIFLCNNFIMCEEENGILVKSFFDVMNDETHEKIMGFAGKTFECPCNGEENYWAKFSECWCLTDTPQRKRRMLDFGLEAFDDCSEKKESNDEYCESLNGSMDRILDNLKKYQQDDKCPCLSDPSGIQKSAPQAGMNGMKLGWRM